MIKAGAGIGLNPINQSTGYAGLGFLQGSMIDDEDAT